MYSFNLSLSRTVLFSTVVVCSIGFAKVLSSKDADITFESTAATSTISDLVRLLKSDFCSSKLQTSDSQNVNVYLLLSLFRIHVPYGMRYRQLVYEEQRNNGLLSLGRLSTDPKKSGQTQNIELANLNKIKLLHLREPKLLLDRHSNPLSPDPINPAIILKVSREHDLQIEFFRCTGRMCRADLNAFLEAHPSAAQEESLQKCAEESCNIQRSLPWLCGLTRQDSERYRLCLLKSCFSRFYKSLRASTGLSKLLQCAERDPSCRKSVRSIRALFSNFLKSAEKMNLPTLPTIQPVPGDKASKGKSKPGGVASKGPNNQNKPGPNEKGKKKDKANKPEVPKRKTN